MSTHPVCISPDQWLRQLFSAKSAIDGGVIRRQVHDIERILGRDAFAAEVRRRGYRMVENAGQFVVFCNREPVHVVV